MTSYTDSIGHPTQPKITFTFFKPKDRLDYYYHHHHHYYYGRHLRAVTFEDDRPGWRPGDAAPAIDYFGRAGTLLESKEKGVIYPMIHFAPCRRWNGGIARGSPTKGSMKSHDDDDEYAFEQGVYSELASVRADLFGSSHDDLFEHRSRSLSTWPPPPPWTTYYLVLGFKQIPRTPFKETMERHWKDWTGARYLYLNFPDEFGLVRLTLYKRCPRGGDDKESATDIDLFLYVLLAECVHVITEHQRLFIKDFVERMRADKMPPFVALYEHVERPRFGHEFASTHLDDDEPTTSDYFGTTPCQTTSVERRRRVRSLSSESRSSSGSPSQISGSPIPSYRTTLTISTR